MAADEDEGDRATAAASGRAVAEAGRRAGRGLRAVAIDLFGAARVDAEWTPDGPMRAAVRRLARRGGDGEAPSCGTGPGSGVPAGSARRERSP